MTTAPPGTLAGRVRKDDGIITCLGTLDEAISAIGLARAWNAGVEGHNRIKITRLIDTQKTLYAIMAAVAGMKEWTDTGETRGLELAIDNLDSKLPPLTEFIIPGTSINSAVLHQARVAVRRAEREMVATGFSSWKDALAYINRLSDLLFTMARAADFGHAETFKS